MCFTWRGMCVSFLSTKHVNISHDLIKLADESRYIFIRQKLIWQVVIVCSLYWTLCDDCCCPYSEKMWSLRLDVFFFSLSLGLWFFYVAYCLCTCDPFLWGDLITSGQLWHRLYLQSCVPGIIRLHVSSLYSQGCCCLQVNLYIYWRALTFILQKISDHAPM